MTTTSAAAMSSSSDAFFILLLSALLMLSVGTRYCRASDASPSAASPAVVSRIAFGSCSNQSAPQPVWDAIIDFDPQVFVWLGDNIYGDNKHPFRLFGKQRTIGPWKNTPRFFPSTEEEMRKRYEMAKNNPGYSKLRRRAQVIGTWDDHDYGLNDAGKEFGGKDTSQGLLLDFLDEPEDSPRRKQAGVYTSYVFGPKGKQVKVILLDTRYHRDPMFSDGTILGNSQWEWLEKELNGPGTEFTIIASSIQVVSNLSATTGPFFHMEAWGRFPRERERLYKLINDSKRNGTFFISGDIHFGEIARYDCGARYPLYDITSSGLTQAIEQVVPQPLAIAVRTIAWLTPSTMRVFNAKCQYRSCTYARPNFGAIEIDWDATPPRMRVQLRNAIGHVVAEVDFSFSEFQQNGVHISSREGKYKHHCSLESELPWFRRYSLALIIASIAAVTVATSSLLLFIAVSLRKKLLKSKID